MLLRKFWQSNVEESALVIFSGMISGCHGSAGTRLMIAQIHQSILGVGRSLYAANRENPKRICYRK